MSKTVTIDIPEELYMKAKESLCGRNLTVEAFIRVVLRGILQKDTFVGLHDNVNFGKYRGETLETIIKADPAYIRWLLLNFKGFSTDEDSIALLEMIEASNPSEGRN